MCSALVVHGLHDKSCEPARQNFCMACGMNFDKSTLNLGGHATFTTAPFGLVNPRASWDWVWGCQKYRGRVPGVPGQKVALPETRPQDRAHSKQCCCIEKTVTTPGLRRPPTALGRALDPPARLGLGSGSCQHWQACPLPTQRALCAHYLARLTVPPQI